MKLVVIEGIGKKASIEKYLGPDYKVFATKGHVRDLPKKSLAVDIKDNFKPTYSIMSDKADVVNDLKKNAKNAELVYLATDPDREGEAISWHLASILGIDPADKVRITFNEISKKAIATAIASPRIIDQSIVDAQQARRVLDRLVGYKLSPLLCTKIQSKLSAGRVQSVTLKLICERETEIRNFIPEEYWPFASILIGKNKGLIKATLAQKKGKKIKLICKDDVDNVLSDIDGKPYIVSTVKKNISKSHAPAPFKTSTLEQDAINKLNMSLKSVTMSAQSLYEGVELPGEGKVALVTYIRTDSVRVSPDAIAMARNHIQENYGDKYLPEKPNLYASKGAVQDAHEAIRPISLNRTPISLKTVLSPQLYKLYKLIYDRFLASQMSEAEYNALNADVKCDEYTFKVQGKTLLFDGYTVLYNTANDDENEEDDMKKLPDLNEGEELGFKEYKFEQKFTKPPARYTEASIIKVMEEKGIGRPATYHPTISLLENREYIVKEKKSILPTDLGFKVVELLDKYFPDIMNVAFTADMESKLDDIENGGKIWQQIIAEFYAGFEKELKVATGDDFTMKEPPVETDIVCEKCGKNMLIRTSKYGKFLACSGYPKCKSTKQLDENGNIAEKTEQRVEESDVVCEKCGAKMVVKSGKRGKFLACPNYPDCKNIKNINEPTDLPNCPTCGKPMKMINYFRGTFFGCSGYPECKFTLYDKPINKKCEICGSILTEKVKRDGKYEKCSNKECDYIKKIEE